MGVKIVTDSTADLPPEVAQAWGITVVPLNVHFGDEVFLDGVTITPDQFYHRLTTSPVLPKTSQPSVSSFLECYRRLLPGAEGIVSIHISSRLSGTYSTALLAREELGETPCPIEVIDTPVASIALGLVALHAARLASRGAGLQEVVQGVRRRMGEVTLLGMVDTLEYLEKGGRIGRATAFLGSLLQVKPIITIREGTVHPVERVRTRPRGIQRLAEMVASSAPVDDLTVIHSTTPQEAGELARRLRPYSAQGDVMVARFGPVVGTYLGPGALGVAWCPHQ